MTRGATGKSFARTLLAMICVVFVIHIIGLSSVRCAPRDVQPVLSAEFLHNGFWSVIQVDSTLVCAMNGGIGVLTFDTVSSARKRLAGEELNIEAPYGESVSEKGLFKIRDFFPLAQTPISLRYDDSSLVVRLADDTYLFFSLSTSLKLRKLGSVRYPVEIQDYLYSFGNLYFAEEFRGVTLYRVDNFSALHFLDSSMVGVRVVQLALARDTLYALDDYNGILRYPKPELELRPIDGFMYLPFQIQSFSPFKDYFNLAVGLSGIKSVTFDSLGAFSAFFERQTISFASRVLETDSNYVVVSTPNVLETQDKRDPGALNLIPVSGNTLGATIATFGEKQVFVTPFQTSGLSGLWMNVTGYPQEFAEFDHPGPIRSLHIADGFLYTAGSGNPFEKYALIGTDGPTLIGSRSFPAGAIASASQEDTLYLIDNASEVPLVWIVLASRDSLPLPLGVFGIPPEVDDISIHQGLDGGKEFLLRAGSKFHLIRTAAGELFNSSSIQLNLGVGVTSATVERGRIYHYSSKLGKLALSKLSRVEGVVEISSINLPGAIRTMLTIDGRNSLLMFSKRRIRRVDIQSPDELALSGEFFVSGDYFSAVERDGLIFAVGPNSTGVLAFVNDTLEELYYAPSGANLVTAGTGMFATSNGSSIKLYEFLQTGVDDEPLVLNPADFHLLDNYPNPFNGETLIRFSGAPVRGADSRVVVYNVLGQKVRELSLGDSPDGVVRWDGRNERGVDVASGMYFARLIGGDSTVGRAIKMIYLK